MIEIKEIIDSFYHEGENLTKISEHTGFDRKTIRKYVERADWNKNADFQKKDRSSKLDSFKEVIDTWLSNDRKARPKQRHTAQRVFNRLKSEYTDTFDCSYRTVAEYVKQKRKVFFQKQDGSLPLKHYAGEAEVDFGEADFYEKGIKFSGSYLVVSFPFSNAGYLQLFKGENSECLLEGMKSIFKHIGGVPSRIVFDNASTIVVNIEKDGKRIETDSFLRFRFHHNFASDFCNPNAGNEKGNVESKVGYLRRNLFVPVPEFSCLKEFNSSLLERCDQDNKREHYAKNQPICELFKLDKQKFRDLPATEFEVAKYQKVNTNGYGKFTLNEGRHIYSTSPKYSNSSVNVKITAYSITPLNDNHDGIIDHPRLYGNEKQESMKWAPYLTQISIKSKAIIYTELFDSFPKSVQNIFHTTSKQIHSQVLKAMVEFTNKSSLEIGVSVLEEAAKFGRYDIESLRSIYNRITNTIPELSPVITPTDTPYLPNCNIDMTIYDKAFLPLEVPLDE
jgi:transposase